MTELLLTTLLAGVQLWLKREDNIPYKTKQDIADRVLELKRKWYEEYSKSIKDRSDDKLVRIDLELRFLAERFTVAIRNEAVAGKQE